MYKQKIADIELVSFHPRHLEIMKLRDEEKKYLSDDSSYSRFEDLAKRSLQSVSVIHDGRILTCCGFEMIFPGVCELWQVPSLYAQQFPIVYAKTMKDFVEIVAKTVSVHRMQTTTKADDLHRRWMQFLDFEEEGVMKQYTHFKEDHIIWGRIFPCQ